MKEIAKGVLDVTGHGKFSISEDGETVTVEAGVFVVSGKHVNVKRHPEANDTDLIISTRVKGNLRKAAGGKTPAAPFRERF